MFDLASLPPTFAARHVAVWRDVPRLSKARHLVALHWLLIAFVAIFTTRSMWAPSLLWGHSAWFDLVRMVEFTAAIRAGDLLPTWSPDLYSGHGSPLFQFYAPLVYYVAEVPVLAGFAVPTALKIAQLFLLIASGIAMYQLAAANVSRGPACFSALLYMLAPYRFVDLFVRHALAEHAAFVWFPLLVLGTQRFAKNRDRTGALAAIFASAGLSLTHNVMALLGLPLCLAAGAFLGASAKDWRTVARALLPAIVGLGLTAFFWLPALTGRVFTRADECVTGGYFDYRQHFVSNGALLGFTVSDGMPLELGWANLLVLLAGGVLLLRGCSSRWCSAGFVIALGSLFMCTASSRAIWSALPMLKFAQFPWRFLALAVFGSAICGAAVADRISVFSPRMKRPALALGLALCVSLCFPAIAPEFVAADPVTQSIKCATPEQIDAFDAQHRLLAVSEIVTPESIRKTQERATSSDDFLPREVAEKPMPAPELITSTAGEVTQIERLARNGYRASVKLRKPGRIELHQFQFPGWRATLDGGPVETFASGRSALVGCDAPAGDHVVEFSYSAMPQRRAGLAIAGISLLTAVAILSLGKASTAIGDFS